MTIDSLWEELESQSLKIIGTGILKRMLSPEATCNMFLGVKCPLLIRLFMVQVLRNTLPLKQQIPELRGFKLTLEKTGEEADTHETLTLSTTDPIYNEVFSAMADNLYQKLKNCKEERRIAYLFMECLSQWQIFFEKNGIDGLSEAAQLGLYGELYFLKNHLLSNHEYYADAISAWTGPKARQHDFQFGNTVIEVKTCSAKQHQKLQISSEQQLDDSVVENLFLYHLSISSIENHKDTLTALINQIRDILHEHPAALSFEKALLQRGYLNIHAWRYQTTGYGVRESNLFHVTGDFPRLTEKDLPIGVGNLTYSISVAECKKFSVQFDELASQILRERT